MLLKLRAKQVVHEIFFYLPYLRHELVRRYRYMFEPDQLIQLTKFIEETKDVPGSFFEVGCAAGDTTIFLNKYMARRGLHKTYVAIDTFEGFQPADVEYEISIRGKVRNFYDGTFQFYKKKHLEAGIALEGLKNIRIVQIDATRYDFTEPIAFCLLDVDLYLPIKKVLPMIYDVLSPGGVIVVDDCSVKDKRWDGALEAYLEFVSARALPTQIVCDKLGIIRR